MKVLWAGFVTLLLATSVASSIAQPNCIDGETIPSVTDCTKFKVCVSGKWRDQRCPDGQYFNKIANKCIPYDGSCGGVKPPVCVDGEIKPDADCNKFKVCVSGKWRDQNCPDGQYFNKIKENCIPHDGSCGGGKPPVCVDGEIKPDVDCTKFKVCVSEKWRDQKCPDGQYFNKIKENCIPHDGSCGSVNNKIANKCIPADGACKHLTKMAIETISTKLFHPNLCLGQPLGRKIRYCYDLRCVTGDCTKFVTCKNDLGVPTECENKKHFNASFQTCDAPEKAKCSWS